jgi:hypothetical protein
MKVLVTEFISLDGVVQAPGAPSEDTDGGFAYGGCVGKYFDPKVIGGTFDEMTKQSDALRSLSLPNNAHSGGIVTCDDYLCRVACAPIAGHDVQSKQP